MMVLGLGDIVFCLFGWGGGGSKLESPGAGIFFFFFFFFFFTGEADSHGSFIFFTYYGFYLSIYRRKGIFPTVMMNEQRRYRR